MKPTFYIPSFWLNAQVNLRLIRLFQEHPEYFYDINIGAVYGAFPCQIWNGGRVIRDCDPGIQNIVTTVKEFNELNIPIRFTYTNSLITEEHLNDPICNFITDLANNGMNEIIVNSPILEKYLRNKYPNFKYISSTTKCLLDNNEIKNELDKYYLTVLDFRKNRDYDFLKTLDKSKVEILINAYCDEMCPHRYEHYEHLSNMQLGKVNYDYECETFYRNFLEILKMPMVIHNDELYDYYYKELGFHHFKIEGRVIGKAGLIEGYLYYLIKPEYKEIVRFNLFGEGIKAKET